MIYKLIITLVVIFSLKAFSAEKKQENNLDSLAKKQIVIITKSVKSTTK